MSTLGFFALVDLDTADGTLSLVTQLPSSIMPGEPFLTDPLSIGWATPIDKPGQPDPVEARFSIVNPGPIAVDIGRRVSVRVYDDTGDFEIAALHGRVTDAVASPIDYELSDGTPQSGTLVDVVAVDFVVDLAEVPCTTGVLPAGRADARMSLYGDAIDPADLPGWDPVVQGFSGHTWGIDSWVYLKAEDATTGRALERLLGVLDQVGLGYLPGGPGAPSAAPSPSALDRRLATRGILAPRVNATTYPADYPDANAGEGDWFTIDEPSPYYDSDDPDDFPAVLTDGPDGWGLVIDGASPLVVDADLVDWGAKFTRSKFTHPNRAEVTYTPSGGTDETAVVVEADDRGTSDPIATIALSAPLLGEQYPTSTQDPDFAPRRMALMYLPESDARDRWQADAFRYYLPNWDRLVAGSWFPRHHDVDLVSPGTTPGDPPTRASCYTRPVVVDGINPNHNPTGRSWYAGELAAVTLTLADERAVVDFTLRRVLPIPAGDGALAIEDVDPAITLADLDPAFTYYDYRLARGA